MLAHVDGQDATKFDKIRCPKRGRKRGGKMMKTIPKTARGQAPWNQPTSLETVVELLNQPTDILNGRYDKDF